MSYIGYVFSEINHHDMVSVDFQEKITDSGRAAKKFAKGWARKLQTKYSRLHAQSSTRE